MTPHNLLDLYIGGNSMVLSWLTPKEFSIKSAANLVLFLRVRYRI